MHKKINKYLDDLEAEKNIKILLACETGSRAWGFPSPDSDYDVRMIYVHKKDWYLSLNEQKDSIERMLENNDIDISGWDLRKTLRLLAKSNPALLERIQSPVIYRCEPDFLSEINTLAKEFYSRIATIYHYRSLSKKCLDDIKATENYKLKRFFYALRSAVACQWILEKTEMPPIEFSKMLAGLNLSDSRIKRIATLIELKAESSEKYLHKGENDLIEFIENCLSTAEQKGKTLPSANVNFKALNHFFRKMLTE